MQNPMRLARLCFLLLGGPEVHSGPSRAVGSTSTRFHRPWCREVSGRQLRPEYLRPFRQDEHMCAGIDTAQRFLYVDQVTRRPTP